MYKHLPSPVKFREDINGLRAWAVIAVLLFHFSVIGLPGGFAGVDIFFVISGYLMTAIIVEGNIKGSFSILKFYMARVRRIVPALIAVVIAVLSIGWFFLLDSEYQQQGSEAFHALTFSSNFYYTSTANYFDSVAERKWLLHTWSLAVEAQFYILYPLFLTLVWKIKPSLKILFVSVILVFLISLSLNIALTVLDKRPNAVFYLLPTRGWELAAGGLVYFVLKMYPINKTTAQLSYWTGWGLIFLSLIIIDEHLAWPGYWAILTVLGTSLALLSNSSTCKLTINPIAQWLGERSYSLYLWHWPLVVILYLTGNLFELSWNLIAFAVSLVLAHLSYIFIETPTRKYFAQKTLVKEVSIIFIFMFMLISSALFIENTSLNQRAVNQSEQGRYVYNYTSQKSDLYKIRFTEYWHQCNFYDINKNRVKEQINSQCLNHDSSGVLLWGDSHAQALSYGIRNFLAQSNTGFSQITSSGCRASIDSSTHLRGDFKQACIKSNQTAMQYIEKNKPKVVILAQAGGHNKGQLITVANHLTKTLKVANVIIVGPTPQWETDLPVLISRHYWQKSPPLTKINDSLDKQVINMDTEMQYVIKGNKNKSISYISLIDGLCNKKAGCIAKLDVKNTPIIFDYGHLTLKGSDYVVKNLLSKQIIEKTKQ